MSIKRNYNSDQYLKYLEQCGFNEDQVNFIADQRNAFKEMKENARDNPEEFGFDEDTYERDMWYTMNRSGLFEDDDENKSGITNWGVTHTRRFITEY